MVIIAVLFHKINSLETDAKFQYFKNQCFMDQIKKINDHLEIIDTLRLMPLANRLNELDDRVSELDQRLVTGESTESD